jgi:N-acetyl sugar amidotransferase
MKILIISVDYPGPNNHYGDVFVHTRAKQYKKVAEVLVVGFRREFKPEHFYCYEGIEVYQTSDIKKFEEKIRLFDPTIICAHLVHRDYLEVLLKVNKPLAIFFHGFEVLSWRRRLMNYDTIGSLRYLIPYAIDNIKQRRRLRRFVAEADKRKDIGFVFVSNWLRSAVETDLGLAVPQCEVIPNGIDTSLFAYEPKKPEFRKKILLLRSFKGINYANDLMIDAIMALQDKPFFSELEFCIQGEGYLFPILTRRISHLKNVALKNSFVDNQSIPEIHRNYGIFLCASRLDTQGVSMCEAMSSGLVPITTSVGGIPEYSTHETDCFHVSSAKEIAEKIEFLYRNPDVFLTLSQNAAKNIRAVCDLSNTVQKEFAFVKRLSQYEGIVEYRQCVNCVLDTKDDPNITFDSNGVCSHCRDYREKAREFVKTGAAAEAELANIVDKIKREGKRKKYDCIIGLSGGVDSTYLALQAKKLGLRPLAVHFDNGWNSELAVKNIENIVEKLGFDLETFVIDWEEFKNLQLAFLKASVVDIEMITDHAIIATMFRLALKYDIRYILSGTNFVTEGVLPQNWIHSKVDHVHIRAINQMFGSKALRNFPLLTSPLKLRVRLKRIETVSLLNLMPYEKERVKKIITDQLEWQDYGGKHYESVFTRFYQGYILPTKFKIDKRKAHLSNLICSGQITKPQALAELNRPAYDPVKLKSDYQFVLKKLGLSTDEFEDILTQKVRKHADFPVEKDIYQRFLFFRMFRPLWKGYKQIRKLNDHDS